MTITGSSSFPAESREKRDECASIGPVMRNLIAKNILPRDIMTRSAFENAMVNFYTFLLYRTIPTLVGLDDDLRRLNKCCPAFNSNGSFCRH